MGRRVGGWAGGPGGVGRVVRWMGGEGLQDGGALVKAQPQAVVGCGAALWRRQACPVASGMFVPSWPGRRSGCSNTTVCAPRLTAQGSGTLATSSTRSSLTPQE